VNETAPDPAIPIKEGMDRLELGVSQPRLSDRRDIIAIHEFAQVTKEEIYSVLRRRDEIGPQWRILAATEPVLRLAKPSRPFGVWGIPEKLSMQL